MCWKYFTNDTNYNKLISNFSNLYQDSGYALSKLILTHKSQKNSEHIHFNWMLKRKCEIVLDGNRLFYFCCCHSTIYFFRVYQLILLCESPKKPLTSFANAKKPAQKEIVIGK